MRNNKKMPVESGIPCTKAGQMRRKIYDTALSNVFKFSSIIGKKDHQRATRGNERFLSSTNESTCQGSTKDTCILLQYPWNAVSYLIASSITFLTAPHENITGRGSED